MAKCTSRITFILLLAATRCARVMGEVAGGAALPSEAGADDAALSQLTTFGGLELFLDDQTISWKQNIERRIKRPRKHASTPLIRAEYPWEERYMTLYGTVMRNAATGKYRMWYNAYGADYRKQAYLAYAESDDGLAWRKPMMDILPFNGQRSNLLLGRDTNVHGPCVLINPQAPEKARYLAIYDSYTHLRPESAESALHGRAVYASTSEDGLHFEPATGRMIVLGKSDIGHSAVWNPDRERIQLYMRGVNEYREEGAAAQRVRYVRYAESADGQRWSQPIELMRADEVDGAPDSQIHQLTVTRYGNVYIGLLTLFRIVRLEFGGEHMGEKIERMEHGVTDTQLAFSRDGIEWTRVADRETYLPRGSVGAWDGGWIVTSSDLVVDGDEVRIYYAGFPERYSVGRTSIGLATLPLDRFVAMKSARLGREGIIELKPVRYADGDVVLNADASKGGRIEAEVLDFDGNVIAGFERTAFAAIEDDRLRHALRWRNGGREKKLDDAVCRDGSRVVRLRLYLYNAEVYSLRNASSE
jgi:hypothetical protein